MNYEEPKKYSKSEIELIIFNNNYEAISSMLVGVAFNEEDLAFAYSVINNFLNHENVEIVGLSIICLAHLARIHGKIPKDETINSLRIIINSKNGSSDAIKGRVGDAVGDFSVYQPEIYSTLIKEFPNYFRELGF